MTAGPVMPVAAPPEQSYPSQAIATAILESDLRALSYLLVALADHIGTSAPALEPTVRGWLEELSADAAKFAASVQLARCDHDGREGRCAHLAVWPRPRSEERYCAVHGDEFVPCANQCGRWERVDRAVLIDRTVGPGLTCVDCAARLASTTTDDSVPMRG